MKRRFKILPVYNGPQPWLNGRTRHRNVYGEYVKIERTRIYLEVFPR